MIKLITASIVALSILAGTKSALVKVAHADQVSDAMTNTSEQCLPLQKSFDAALAKPGTTDQSLKAGEIPKLTQALKAQGNFTVEQSQNVKKKVEAAANFKELSLAFTDFASLHCLSARMNISRALIGNFNSPKLSATDRKELAEVLRAQWRSEINSTAVGLAVNSALALTACDTKSDKGLGLKCGGLKEFRGKLRSFTRNTQRDARKAMETFSFWGRILFYWDKWILRKEIDRRASSEVLDRYYKIGPSKKILLDEYTKTQTLRQEFESFLL